MVAGAVGESARLAAIAGVAATGLALVLPRWTGPTLGIGAALLLLLAPALVHLGFAGGVDAAGLPFSVAHRLLIWDFTAARIWDSPWIGWGMDAARAIPGAILPFPGGVVRSGSKVGSRYKGMIASTNDAYCPGLAGRPGSALTPEVGAVLEIVIDGTSSAEVAQSMRAGLHASAATGATVRRTSPSVS